MLKFCAHGHPLEEWMTECPYCDLPAPGVRKVLGGTPPPDLSDETPTELTPPPAEKAEAAARAGLAPASATPLRPKVMDTATPPELQTLPLQPPGARPAGEFPLGGWLVVMNGPQKWNDLRLDRAAVTIGRDPACELHLDDPRLALRHAVVNRQKDAFVLEPADPGAAVRINAQPEPVRRHQLQDQDLIRLGAAYIKFRKL